MTKRILSTLPALLIVGVSWHLSSQEQIEEMPSFYCSDKVVHLVCFAGLSFWVAFSVAVHEARRRLQVVLPVVLVSVYGAVDEFHQSFVDGRSSDLLDWVSDSVGAVVGSYVFLWLLTVARRRTRAH